MSQKSLKIRHFVSQTFSLINTNDTSTFFSQKKNTSISNKQNIFESSPTQLSKSTSSEIIRISKGKSGYLKLNTLSLNLLQLQDVSDNLQILVLNDCHLKELPLNFNKLSNIKQLSLDSNHFTKIPLLLIENFDLETFSIKNNYLEVLPEKYFKWNDSLISLDVSYNQIDRLADSLSELQCLKKLFVNNNNFIKVPTTLYNLSLLEEFALDWFKYTFPPNPFLISGDLLKNFLNFCQILSKKSKSYFTFIELLETFSKNTLELTKLFAKKRNLIHQAAFENDVGALRSLIKLLPNHLNEIDSENYSALFLSILEENYNATKILLFSGADPSIGVGMLGSCIHLAVVKKEIFLLQDLLRRGGDSNSLDQKGNTPLHLLFSTFSNNVQKSDKMAKILIEFQANPQIKNKELWNCLHLAVKSDQIEAVKWAINYNKREEKEIFDLNQSGGEINMTLLHLAGYQGNRKILGLLLESNCDYLISDSLNRLPKNLCVNDQFLLKLIKSKEKYDILKDIIKKKNSKKGNKLMIEVEELSDKEESNHINLPCKNSNHIGFFSSKSRYFSNQNKIKPKLFSENNEENYAGDCDETNDRRFKSIRVILNSPNNIEKIEQYQNVRMNLIRKSCGSSFNFTKGSFNSKLEQNYNLSLKSFSFKNLETIVNGLNETNEKMKEQLNKKPEEIKENEFFCFHMIIILQRKSTFLIKELNREISMLDSFFKGSQKIKVENMKEFQKIMNTLNKKEFLQNSCKSFLLNSLFFNMVKKDAIENLRIGLLIIQNIQLLSISNFHNDVRLFLQKSGISNFNKLLVYEIYNLMLSLKNITRTSI